MSDEKGLLEKEGKEVEEEEGKEVEEVELTKIESSSVEEEEMTEKKPAVEKSDRCELMYSVICTKPYYILQAGPWHSNWSTLGEWNSVTKIKEDAVWVNYCPSNQWWF